MARDVNFNDPSSWDDDDKVWLSQRIDRVPAEHRHLLKDPAPAFAPEAVGESPELARLRSFLEDNFPEDWAEGETPVGLAIRLLTENTEAEETVDELTPEAPDYDKWKAAELVAEIETRRANGRNIPGDKLTKAEAAAALRADDAKA
jgi:hypothetical protein